ncbi:MAG TPA: GNAT family protein [Desulfomonilaceae bacterium]|nr:GNAT family protein [Desulfomonilaceae bacterium]
MLKDYPKAIVTQDGTSVLLRPVTRSDEEALKKFFSLIPDAEKWFLIEKFTDSELLHEWIEQLNYDRVLPIVAVVEDSGEIIGNVRLYRSSSPSVKHVAHMRVTVLPAYRHLKVGGWMILDSVKQAMDLGIEKIIAEMVEGLEDPAVNAALKLGFRQEGLLPNYVKDRRGRLRNLIIMVKNLPREWSDF